MCQSESLSFTFLLFGLKASLVPQTAQTPCLPSLLFVYAGTLYMCVWCFGGRFFCLHADMDERGFKYEVAGLKPQLKSFRNLKNLPLGINKVELS